MNKHYLLIIFLLILKTTVAQSNKSLRLFVDCRQVSCDLNYLREQLFVVDFVRDRQLCDVHIMLIKQPAGNGGEKFDVILSGKGQYSLRQDTLSFISLPNSSADQERKQLTKTIQAGLVSYLAKAGLFNKMNISFIADSSKDESISRDKWNNWIFSIGGRGNFSADNNYKESNIGLNSSASRVTEKSKWLFSFYKSSSINSYKILDSSSETNLKTRNAYMEFEQEFVKSISSNWSWAFGSAFRKSTYDNLTSALSTSAGIEYGIFPYKSSNTKFLTMRYELELTQRTYTEQTIFNKKSERLVSNNLGMYAYFTQPWGSISSNITWYNYLHDFSKNNLSMYANVQLQLFKGISINFFGTGSLINDQLNLSKAGATQEEVLLKLKVLSKNFNYYTGIGINYKFGSKFNNYINPRFTNGRY